MKSSRRAIRKAQILRIDAVLTTLAITAEVLSVAPEQETLPYVRLGSIRESFDPEVGRDNSEVLTNLTVYSSSADQAEIIAEAIQEDLTGSTKLVLDGGFSVYDQMLETGFSAEQDLYSEGPVFGASLQIRYLIEHQ